MEGKIFYFINHENYNDKKILERIIKQNQHEINMNKVDSFTIITRDAVTNKCDREHAF